MTSFKNYSGFKSQKVWMGEQYVYTHGKDNTIDVIDPNDLNNTIANLKTDN